MKEIFTQIFVAVASLTRQGNKSNTVDGNGVSPCISSVDPYTMTV